MSPEAQKPSARSCRFCRLPLEPSPEARRESEEHVYPKWLAKFWPPAASQRLHGNFDTGLGASVSEPVERSMPITSYQQVVRGLCVGCNTWLDRKIERPARDVMTALFRGEPVRLRHSDRGALASWGWKTSAMILLLGSNVSHAVTSAEYEWFRQNKTPPQRSIVWLGTYDRNTKGLAEAYRPWTSVAPHTQPKDGLLRNVYTNGFTAGNLFFLVFGTSAPTMAPLAPRGQLAASVRKIWPAPPEERLDWPFSPVVDDELFEKFAVSCLHMGPLSHGIRTGRPAEVLGYAE